MWNYLLTALGISVLINVVLFLVAFRRGTDKLTDASYALSFIALTVYGLTQTAITPFKIILASMVTIWAVRLGIFLVFRIWHIGKDSRFDDMRGNFWRFGKFWLSQAVAVWLILIPSLLALHYQAPPLVAGAWIGLLLWLIGLAVEAAADLQKYRFSRESGNNNRWIDTGLWRYSRHPNYFGEIVVWVGIYFYAATVLTPLESLAGLVSPLLIAALLLLVSGVPILEKAALKRWGSQPAYQDYKQRTSILVPWPPKR